MPPPPLFIHRQPSLANPTLAAPAQRFLRQGVFSLKMWEHAMHETRETSSAHKPDLRDDPSTSLKTPNVQSPVQDPQRENSSDQQRPRSGPDIVKPGVGGQATGQI